MLGKYINQFMADNELSVNEEFFIENMDGNRVLIGCADRYKIEDVDGGILTAAVMNEKDKPPAMLLEAALIDLLRENYFVELIGRIGSRFSFTTFFKNKDKGITVSCGCFLGTIAEFRAKVTDTHGNNKHAKMYNLAADMAELQILGEEHFDKLNTNKSEPF